MFYLLVHYMMCVPLPVLHLSDSCLFLLFPDFHLSFPNNRLFLKHQRHLNNTKVNRKFFLQNTSHSESGFGWRSFFSIFLRALASLLLLLSSFAFSCPGSCLRFFWVIALASKPVSQLYTLCIATVCLRISEKLATK